jgi:hypothetical protein
LSTLGRLALLGFSVDASVLLLYGCFSGVFVALADLSSDPLWIKGARCGEGAAVVALILLSMLFMIAKGTERSGEETGIMVIVCCCVIRYIYRYSLLVS